jgi:hypothetical protein
MCRGIFAAGPYTALPNNPAMFSRPVVRDTRNRRGSFFDLIVKPREAQWLEIVGDDYLRIEVVNI